MVENVIESFLHAHQGRVFCAVCVAKMLDIASAEVVAASKRLQHVAGFTVARGTCANCDETRTVLGFVGRP